MKRWTGSGLNLGSAKSLYPRTYSIGNLTLTNPSHDHLPLQSPVTQNHVYTLSLFSEPSRVPSQRHTLYFAKSHERHPTHPQHKSQPDRRLQSAESDSQPPTPPATGEEGKKNAKGARIAAIHHRPCVHHPIRIPGNTNPTIYTPYAGGGVSSVSPSRSLWSQNPPFVDFDSCALLAISPAIFISQACSRIPPDEVST